MQALVWIFLAVGAAAVIFMLHFCIINTTQSYNKKTPKRCIFALIAILIMLLVAFLGLWIFF